MVAITKNDILLLLLYMFTVVIIGLVLSVQKVIMYSVRKSAYRLASDVVNEDIVYVHHNGSSDISVNISLERDSTRTTKYTTLAHKVSSSCFLIQKLIISYYSVYVCNLTSGFSPKQSPYFRVQLRATYKAFVEVQCVSYIGLGIGPAFHN